jgi:hypothetical protein
MRTGCRSVPRLYNVVLASAIVSISVVVVPMVTGAAIVPPQNPPNNISPSPDYSGPCAAKSGVTSACPLGLSTLDADRSVEGVGPMSLPSDFASLTSAQQIFVLANLERVDRSLSPIVSLSSNLNSYAQAGAQGDTDPSFPPNTQDGGSNWASGNIFSSDALWMYEDGWNGADTINEDCSSPTAPGCWGHRDNILGSYPAPALMGAGYVASGGGSVAELFVGDDTNDTPSFTWSEVTQDLPVGISVASINDAVLPGATQSTTVQLWASGEAMDISLKVSGENGTFSLNSSQCSLGAGASCEVNVTFAPPTLGTFNATLLATGPNGTQSVPLQGIASPGYRLVGADGGLYSFGGASFLGSTGGSHLNRPIVGMADDTGSSGYWLVATDGGIFSFGAPFYGSTGGTRLNRPIVGMAATPDGGGYWLVASDGGIFSFGSAHFYGSTGSTHLNRPIVGMASTPDGGGYWLVASDGGIFSFGDAHFYGSTGSTHLNRPIVGMASTPDGGGYWLVASDGGIFSFGDAQFYGSTGSTPLNKPIAGIAAAPNGGGYWLVASDGGIFSFGDASFLGSAGGTALNAPVVGMAIG